MFKIRRILNKKDVDELTIEMKSLDIDTLKSLLDNKNLFYIELNDILTKDDLIVPRFGITHVISKEADCVEELINLYKLSVILESLDKPFSLHLASGKEEKQMSNEEKEIHDKISYFTMFPPEEIKRLIINEFEGPSFDELALKFNRPVSEFKRRNDKRIEWICEHGVGHTVWYPPGSSSSHGCDGCCKELKGLDNNGK